MPMINLDPEVTALAQRLHAKHGHRASEYYIYALSMKSQGVDLGRVEQILDGLSDAAGSLPLDECVRKYLLDHLDT